MFYDADVADDYGANDDNNDDDNNDDDGMSLKKSLEQDILQTDYMIFLSSYPTDSVQALKGQSRKFKKKKYSKRKMRQKPNKK